MKKDIHITPKSMNINVMQQLLSSTLQNNPSVYYTEEFAIGTGENILGKALEVSSGGPYIIEDYRIGMVVCGELDVTINLIDYHVSAGQMLFVGRGSISHVHQTSPDTLIKIFVFSSDLVSQVFPVINLSLLSSTATAFVHEASIADRKFFDNMLISIWSLVHSPGYPKQAFHSLVAALFNYYDYLFSMSSNHPQKANNLFSRFISLVNKHSDCERSISFYADKLCLSPRYFSTLVQEQSGKPAKHWIDKAVVTRAKVLLRHTTKTVSQISAELNFPNDSFFCKFFRRLTGSSPTEYRGDEGI